MEKDMEASKLITDALGQNHKSSSHAGVKSSHLETVIFHLPPHFLIQTEKMPSATSSSFSGHFH